MFYDTFGTICNNMENVVQFFGLTGFWQRFCVLALSKFVESAMEPSGCCHISWYLKFCQHFLKNMLSKPPWILKMYNIDMIRHANTSKMTRLFFKMLSFFLYLRFLPTSAYPVYHLRPAFGIQCPKFGIMNQTPDKEQNLIQLNMIWRSIIH